MAIEIVDLPIKNGGSFHSYVNVYQRVTTMTLWTNYQPEATIGYPYELIGIARSLGICWVSLRQRFQGPGTESGYDGYGPMAMGKKLAVGQLASEFGAIPK